VTLLLGLAVLESSLQLLGAARRAASRHDPAGGVVIDRDSELGWRPAADRDLPVVGGGRFTTGPRGWRRFEIDSSKPLLLVIGDSFTHAVGVADGETYYDHIAAELDLAVAALGVDGYGTVQEWLLLRTGRLPPPRWLLLQMHDNDVVNDSFALERRSWHNNNLLSRPYLEPDGRIVVGDPRRWFEHLVLGRELTRRVLSRLGTSIEDRIEAGEAEALALYQRELGATARALVRLRGVYPRVPAFAFNAAGGGSRVGRDLARLAEEAGFRYLEIEPELHRRANGHDIVLADGAHWNAAGHALVGEILVPQLLVTR